MSLSRDIFFDYYLTIIWKKNTKQWFQMIAKDFCPMLFVAKENKVAMDRSQFGQQNAEHTLYHSKNWGWCDFCNVFERSLLCSLRLCLFVQKYSKNS